MAQRRYGFYKICEKCGFYKFNDLNNALCEYANVCIKSVCHEWKRNVCVSRSDHVHFWKYLVKSAIEKTEKSNLIQDDEIFVIPIY